jgi:hypothetical protein
MVHMIGEPMAEETQKQTVSLQELMVSTPGNDRRRGKALDSERRLY